MRFCCGCYDSYEDKPERERRADSADMVKQDDLARVKTELSMSLQRYLWKNEEEEDDDEEDEERKINGVYKVKEEI